MIESRDCTSGFEDPNDTKKNTLLLVKNKAMLWKLNCINYSEISSVEGQIKRSVIARVSPGFNIIFILYTVNYSANL